MLFVHLYVCVSACWSVNLCPISTLTLYRPQSVNHLIHIRYSNRLYIEHGSYSLWLGYDSFCTWWEDLEFCAGILIIGCTGHNMFWLRKHLFTNFHTLLDSQSFRKYILIGSKTRSKKLLIMKYMKLQEVNILEEKWFWLYHMYCVGPRHWGGCIDQVIFSPDSVVGLWAISFRTLHYWPFVRGIHWSPMHSSHKGPVQESADVSCIVTHIPTSRIVEQTTELPMIWDTMTLMVRHYCRVDRDLRHSMTSVDCIKALWPASVEE